ncbi:MAG: cation:proton antiporter [Candidatus Nanohaloarchaea archaeon]
MITQLSGAESLAAVIIAAALLGVLARKSRQPTIIAYILTGLLLGPVVFDIVNAPEIVGRMSELGLAFLLFLIGLEIDIDEIREILRPTAVIAVGQMGLVAAAGLLISKALGFTLAESAFIGAAVMYSSTAVVVKLLSDSGQASTLPGKLDIGMLLIEDLAVVVLMAVITGSTGSMAGAVIQVLEVVAVAGLIASFSWLSSRYVLPGLFRELSRSTHTFFIHGVAWALLLVIVSQHFGISMEIGAFLAGISIGQIPYSYELRERIRPLTDFFMAIFFIEIGLGMARDTFLLYWKEAVIASGVLMAAKFIIVFALTDRMKFTPETSFKAALNKSQISEFALVFGVIGVSAGIINGSVLGFLSIVAVVTMGASSYLINYNETLYRFALPALQYLESEEKEDIEVRKMEEHAVVIGYNEISKNVLPALEDYFDSIIIVDKNPQNTEELSSSGYEYIYGDFRHGEIRKAASLKDAEFIMSVSHEPEVNIRVIEEAPENATVMTRGTGVEEAAELYEEGAHYVIRDNILAGEKMQEYVELYLEDRELFLEKVEPEKRRILYGGMDDL